MADKSTIPDDYREIDTTSKVTSDKVEQSSSEVNPKTKEDTDESQRQENKPFNDTISGKISQSLTEAGKEGKNAIRKSFSMGEQDNSEGIKSIVLGLFALIGSFTLVATIISHLYIKR